jgi:hypothetical protein
MKGLSAQELVEHPGYKHLKWNLPVDEDGHVEVAKGRSGGPFKIWYEKHGKGDNRIVVGNVS